MTAIKGINLTGKIVPCTTKDTYATHDSQYGLGGWHEVKTLAERDLIPMDRRRRGMAVFCLEDGKCYTLNTSLSNGGWQPYGSYDVVDIVKQALKSGQIEIDLSEYYQKDEIDQKLTGYATKGEVNKAEADLAEFIMTKADQIALEAEAIRVDEELAKLLEKIEKNSLDISKVDEKATAAQELANSLVEMITEKVDKIYVDTAIEEAIADIPKVEYSFEVDANNPNLINVLKDGVKVASIPTPKQIVSGKDSFVTKELVTYYNNFQGNILPETVDGVAFGEDISAGSVDYFTEANGPYIVLQNVDTATNEVKGGNVVLLKPILEKFATKAEVADALANIKLDGYVTEEGLMEILAAMDYPTRTEMEEAIAAIDTSKFVDKDTLATTLADYVTKVVYDAKIAEIEETLADCVRHAELEEKVQETVEANETIVTLKTDVETLKESKLDASAYYTEVEDLNTQLEDIYSNL